SSYQDHASEEAEDGSPRCSTLVKAAVGRTLSSSVGTGHGKSGSTAANLASPSNGAGPDTDHESVAGDRYERRDTTQIGPVEQARPGAVGVIHAWSLGYATPAGLVESFRSVNRQHQRIKRSYPAGGGETARSVATDDPSWRWRSYGSRVCAGHRIRGRTS